MDNALSGSPFCFDITLKNCFTKGMIDIVPDSSLYNEAVQQANLSKTEELTIRAFLRFSNDKVNTLKILAEKSWSERVSFIFQLNDSWNFPSKLGAFVLVFFGAFNIELVNRFLTVVTANIPDLSNVDNSIDENLRAIYNEVEANESIIPKNFDDVLKFKLFEFRGTENFKFWKKDFEFREKSNFEFLKNNFEFKTTEDFESLKENFNIKTRSEFILAIFQNNTDIEQARAKAGFWITQWLEEDHRENCNYNYNIVAIPFFHDVYDEMKPETKENICKFLVDAPELIRDKENPEELSENSIKMNENN